MAYSGHHQAFASELLRLSSSLSDNSQNSFAAAVSSVLSGNLTSLLNAESLSVSIVPNSKFYANRCNSAMGTDIKALEHQTLKVPYELLNKKFRLTQKNIDREVSHVSHSINELEKGVTQKSEEKVTIGKINELLVGVVNKLNVLKRKSIESISDELEAANVCKRRLEHLKDYCNQSKGSDGDTDNPEMVTWKRKRMDRMLVDHCLRSGYYETAIELAKSSDIEHLTNIDIFLVCKEIEETLVRHETARCLSWCHDNKSKLRKIKSTLEFSLRQQEFIELVRSNQRVEAVRYAQKHFSSLEDVFGSTSAQNELQRVMGLLACSPATSIDRYNSLFDMNRWKRLIEQFRLENFKLYQLSNASIFSITLQAGLSSLKTPQCYRKDGARNSECPVCSELLNKLAVSLPCAHCSQSRLVCFISGEPMNEHNQPLMLPNGYVYGEKSLRKLADNNNGKVVCPRTNSVFDFKDTEKVYVM